MSERFSRDTFRDKRGIETDHGSDDDYSPEDAYSPWKKGNMESFMSNLSKNSGLLIAIIGAAAFVLLAVFVFLPMLRNPAESKPQTAEMESKLKKMEMKVAELEHSYQKVAQFALQDDKIEQLSAKLDKMGTTTTQRLDQMAKDIEALHKQPAPPKAETAPKPPPVQAKPEPPAVKHPPKSESVPKHPPAAKVEPAPKAPAKAEPAPKLPAPAKTEPAAASPPAKPAEQPEKKAGSEKIHEVKPLETLYSISRTYGLSIDELKRLNDIAPTDDTVRTGQKLKVGK